MGFLFVCKNLKHLVINDNQDIKADWIIYSDNPEPDHLTRL